jgi:hypothetical protein
LREEFSIDSVREVLSSGVLTGEERHALAEYASAGLSSGSSGLLRESHGEVTVTYQAPDGGALGRYRSRASGCSVSYAQGMSREVRSYLACDLYHDVDMVNAQPTLTAQLMARHGVACPQLHSYVRERDRWLGLVEEGCGVGRGASKQLLLMMSFMGQPTSWAKEHAVDASLLPDDIWSLYLELKASVPALLAAHPLGARARQQQVSRKPDKANAVATQFAYLVQHVERECLDALVDAVHSDGRVVGALIHDGLLVRREEGAELLSSSSSSSLSSSLSSETLVRWERAIHGATGFEVRLAEKALSKNPLFSCSGGVTAAQGAAGCAERWTTLETRLREQGFHDGSAGTTWRSAEGAAALAAGEVLLMAARTAQPGRLVELTRVAGVGVLSRADGSEEVCVLAASDVAAHDGSPPGVSEVLRLHPRSMEVYLGSETLGSLLLPEEDTPVQMELSAVHRAIDSLLRWQVRRPSSGLLVFEGRHRGAVLPPLYETPHAVTRIEVRNPEMRAHAAIKVMAKGKEYSAPSTKLALLISAWEESVQQGLARLGVGTILSHCNVVVANNVVIAGSIGCEDGVGGQSAAPTDFVVCQRAVLSHALEHRLRKASGHIYEPVEGCPCAYVEKCTYAKYLNSVLRNNPHYLNNSRRFSELIHLLENYELDQIPDLELDFGLLSFSNGVLNLASVQFVEYAALQSQPASHGELRGRVARHHIPIEYTGAASTPLLDTVLSAQLDADVSELLCALLGRMLFRVGQLDDWQVMPYLVGIGGTGKSMILSILHHMVAPGAVGNLASKREDVFGMANLLAKELVIGRDMPAKLSASLPQEVMQCMTAGEQMEVARKGTVATQVTWTAPVIMASNHTPDYVNCGNNVSRRIVSFRFERVVSLPDETLLQRILAEELPNVVCRVVSAYHALRARVEGTPGGFWRCVPPRILEWQSKLAAATNRLHDFLTMEDEDRGCRIIADPARITWLQDLRAAFQRRVSCDLVPDHAVLQQHGFSVSETMANVCLACKQLSKGGSVMCCPQYSQGNRRRKHVVYGMVLEAMDVDVHADGPSTSSPSELRFKAAVEAATGHVFCSARPDWLRNHTGHTMELDMYNDATRVAIEYDGPQHYVFPNPYHSTVEQFQAQRRRDALKGSQCRLNGVKLYRVRAGSSVSEELAQLRECAPHLFDNCIAELDTLER